MHRRDISGSLYHYTYRQVDLFAPEWLETEENSFFLMRGLSRPLFTELSIFDSYVAVWKPLKIGYF